MIDLSADLGEGSPGEDDLWPLISAANVACGGHTGDGASMDHAALLARRYGTKLGAHPSFPDMVDFGRKSLVMEPRALRAALVDQIVSLQEIAERHGVDVVHIKRRRSRRAGRAPRRGRRRHRRRRLARPHRLRHHLHSRRHGERRGAPPRHPPTPWRKSMKKLFVLAAVIAAALAAHAQKFDLTIDNIMRGPGLVGWSPEEVRWTPDGSRVFFASDAQSSTDIFEAPLDGSEPPRLVVSAPNLQVPEDISVTGFDNTDLAAYFLPRLTTVDMHPDVLGRSAADALHDGSSSARASAREYTIQINLVVGKSTGPAPALGAF